MSGPASWFRRQTDEIRRGGLQAVMLKSRHFAGRTTIRILVFVPALATVAVVRLVRPLIHIRIGQLMGPRIGHYVGNTNLYLCERDAGLHDGFVDLFYHQGPVSNRQVRAMWDRRIRASRFFRYVDWVNRMLPGWEQHTLQTSLVDWTDRLVQCEPQLVLTEAELERGRRTAEETLGFVGEHVCFHNRDSAFLAGIHPFADWSYHDHRDSDVANFLPAARLMVGRGYAAVRMGSAVREPIVESPGVIDYATHARDDFMDVYLEATCRFHFGDPSGLNELPRAMRRPVVYTNLIPMTASVMHSLAPGGIFIPKRIRDRKTGRFFAIGDIRELESRVDVYDSAAYDALGLEVIQNTPDEILAVVAEMDDRLAGVWKDTREDDEAQSLFWTLFGFGQHGPAGVRAGAVFLRENPEMLVG